MLVSSAYRIISALSLTVFGKSFMYNKKSSGPSIDPCGMPCFISPQEETETGKLLPKVTFWYLPSR
jgi:hypothetical protein